MKTFPFFRILCGLSLWAFALYSYVNKQNEVTYLKIALPEKAKTLQALKEKNAQLKYEIEQRETPEHLMALCKERAYAHLKYPVLTDILTVQTGEEVMDGASVAKERDPASLGPLAAKPFSIY